jgi:hypothetical protein
MVGNNRDEVFGMLRRISDGFSRGTSKYHGFISSGANWEVNIGKTC